VQELEYEVLCVDGCDPTISSNAEVGRGGHLLTHEPRDPAAVLTFVRNGKQHVFACDRYGTLRDNIRAIMFTLKAIRSIARYDVAQAMDAALSGFVALPPPSSRDWREVLGLDGSFVTAADVDDAWRRLAKAAHPDVAGGSNSRMAELNAARDAAMTEINKRGY
jgi:hypothetical protein